MSTIAYGQEEAGLAHTHGVSDWHFPASPAAAPRVAPLATAWKDRDTEAG